MSTKSEQLKAVVDRARELAEKSDRSDDESIELDSKIAEGNSLRKQMVTNASIDEFEKTLSDQTGGAPETKQSDYVPLAGADYGMVAVAERKGFADAIEKWQAKRLDANWGFDLKYRVKADIDNATAEVNAGAVPAGSTGPQYGGVVQPFYYPGIIEPPTRPPMIADLFAQAATSSNLVRLVKETVTDRSLVGVQAEGAAYGAVKLEVAPVDWPVRDIVGLLPVTEDILMDIPAMSAYLSMRLGKFVQLAEEDELVSGLGTGNHLTGLLHTTDATVDTQGHLDLDTAVMHLLARTYKRSFLDPEWIAMSPHTWGRYVTLRTNLNGGLGQFLAGPPSLAAVRQMWGLPITVTPVIPDDKVIVGNRAAGMIFRNGGMRVESSTGYGTFFGEGLVAIRAKVRTAFAMFRPQAIGILQLGS